MFRFPEEQGVDTEELLISYNRTPVFICPECPKGSYSCGMYPEEHDGECPLEKLHAPGDCCPDFDGG